VFCASIVLYRFGRLILYACIKYEVVVFVSHSGCNMWLQQTNLSVVLSKMPNTQSAACSRGSLNDEPGANEPNILNDKPGNGEPFATVDNGYSCQ